MSSLLDNPALKSKIEQYENASERLIEQAQKIADLEDLLRRSNAELSETARQLVESKRLNESYQDRERQRGLVRDACIQQLQSLH